MDPAGKITSGNRERERRERGERERRERGERKVREKNQLDGGREREREREREKARRGVV